MRVKPLSKTRDAVVELAAKIYINVIGRAIDVHPPGQSPQKEKQAQLTVNISTCILRICSKDQTSTAIHVSGVAARFKKILSSHACLFVVGWK